MLDFIIEFFCSLAFTHECLFVLLVYLFGYRLACALSCVLATVRGHLLACVLLLMYCLRICGAFANASCLLN